MYKYIYDYTIIRIDIQMNSEQRDKIIIGFISNNQGCKAQDIVDGLKDQLSRKPIFDTLDELIKKGIVQDKSKNRRDHRFFIDAYNLLVSVPKELEEFENAFFSLVGKAKQQFDNEYLSIKKSSSQTDPSSFGPILPLLSAPIHIFYDVVNVLLIRALKVWPLRVQDKDALKELFTMVFTKIADMQLRISEIYRSAYAGDMNPVFHSQILLSRLYATQKMIEYFETFDKLGQKKEIESVLDALWNIYDDYRYNAFPEPSLYKWNFNYTTDDWTKLIELQKQYPDQTFGKYVDWTLGTSKK